MAYAAASDVGALCHNLIGSASNFDTSTSPTLAQVNAWLSSGCSLINSIIGTHGYGPIPATSAAYEFARDANALYGAYRAEQSRINARVAPGERTRSDKFKQGFDDAINYLAAIDLTKIGVPAGQSSVYGGGISSADRSTVESNTDRIAPRFNRGLFRNREAKEPTGTKAGDRQSHDPNS